MLIAVFTLTFIGAALIYTARQVAFLSSVDDEDFSFMVPLSGGAGAILVAMALTLGWAVQGLITLL